MFCSTIRPLASAFAVLAVATVLAFADPASAAVGKRVSTASQTDYELTVGEGPNVVLSAPLPSAYKSKSTFLKVTTTFHSSCFYGATSSNVQVDGQLLAGAAYSTEQYGSGYAEEGVSITKVWYLNPQGDVGVTITPESTVNLTIDGGVGLSTLCYIHGATMVVEVLK